MFLDIKKWTKNVKYEILIPQIMVKSQSLSNIIYYPLVLKTISLLKNLPNGKRPMIAPGMRPKTDR